MRVALLTREYPPHVYGGAGVHVEYLARELAKLVGEIVVHCWGGEDDRPAAVGVPGVRRYRASGTFDGAAAYDAALATMYVDLQMAKNVAGADVVHAHTWYAQFGGHLAKLIHGVPNVATVHSLEPMRPWKAEQLGGGYAVSSFCERTGLEGADRVVAVSSQMRRDILGCYPAIDPDRVVVITNGIDTDEYRPDPAVDVLDRYGIDPASPLVVFVGRITRQKGIAHLLDAAFDFDRSAQLVLCAGSPDTPEIGAEIEAGIERLRAARGNVVWLPHTLARREVIQLLGHATVFVCPSIYEPLGIVNLEAMACEAAVVATRTGGIPEVVDDGVTGLLVPFEPRDDGSHAPVDPAGFAADLAARVNELLADPDRAKKLGRAGRERVTTHFAWPAIAARTVELYETLLSK
jgi:starch synthase